VEGGVDERSDNSSLHHAGKYWSGDGVGSQLILTTQNLTTPVRLNNLCLFHDKCQTPSKRRTDGRTDRRQESNLEHL